MVTEEITRKIHDIILTDRRTKVREVAKAVDVLYGTKINIFYFTWKVRYNKVVWTFLSQVLRIFYVGSSMLMKLAYIIIRQATNQTMDFPGEFAPKDAKTPGKVMATIFLDSKGITLIDFVQKGRRFSGQYYSELLHRIDKKSKKTRFHLAKKKLLFHHDNAPAHSSGVAAAKHENTTSENVLV